MAADPVKRRDKKDVDGANDRTTGNGDRDPERRDGAKKKRKEEKRMVTKKDEKKGVNECEMV